MTVGVRNFYGERLLQARLSRGLFMKTLGDMVGLTGTAISRYESGEDKPQAEKLNLLADKLAFPVEFFLRSPWVDDLGLVFWRSRSSETKIAREMTEQRMKWLCEIFSFLESEVDFPHLSLPHVDVPDDFRLITQNVIEQVATQIRKDWGIRNLPIPDMVLALENVGVPVATLEIASEKQDGFLFSSKSLVRPFIGINTHNVSSCRARFDAAHELGHLLLHSRVTPEQELSPASKKVIEDQANRFAGALLFPREAFLSEVRHLSLDYFCDLKRVWGVSIAAMIMRAKHLGIAESDTVTTLFQNMTRRGWRGPLREPMDDVREMPLERPRMLRRAAEIAARTGQLGRAALRSALPIPTNDLEQLLGVDAGFFEDRSVLHFVNQKPRYDKPSAIDMESGKVVEFQPRFNK